MNAVCDNSVRYYIVPEVPMEQRCVYCSRIASLDFIYEVRECELPSVVSDVGRRVFIEVAISLTDRRRNNVLRRSPNIRLQTRLEPPDGLVVASQDLDIGRIADAGLAEMPNAEFFEGAITLGTDDMPGYIAIGRPPVDEGERAEFIDRLARSIVSDPKRICITSFTKLQIL